MPVTEPLPEANLRSPTYFVARTKAKCWHCGLSTRLLALAVPRTHETLDGDWQRANVDAFLFYVEQLSHDVQLRLRQIAPGFRPAQSEATQSSYWANHCEHCGELLEDHELHCEPEGAFVPSSEAAATQIHLLRIPEPIEAVMAGYSPDPAFFGLLPAS